MGFFEKLGLVKTETKIIQIKRKPGGMQFESEKVVSNYKAGIRPVSKDPGTISIVASNYFTGRLQYFFGLLKSPFLFLFFCVFSVASFFYEKNFFFLALLIALACEYVLLKKQEANLQKLSPENPEKVFQTINRIDTIAVLYLVTSILIIFFELNSFFNFLAGFFAGK